jgi:hypothetical protein
MGPKFAVPFAQHRGSAPPADRARPAAAIAFSILFLGPEILRSWCGQSNLTVRHPWIVAFLFGLLHGAACPSRCGCGGYRGIWWAAWGRIG